MAQKTSWTGAALTQSDINTYLMGEGGAWTSWTPAVVQSGSVTTTNTRSRYGRWGRLIVLTTQLAVTSSGTGTNVVTISLPVTAATSSGIQIGAGAIIDTSAGTEYRGVPYLASTTTLALRATATDGGAVGLGATGSTFTAGLASGDSIEVSMIYEAAS